MPLEDLKERIQDKEVTIDPINELKRVLISGLNDQSEARSASIERSLDQMASDSQYSFQQAKEETPEVDPVDVLGGLITSGEVATRLDAGRILSGMGYRCDDDPNSRLPNTIFPTTELPSILKALGVVPENAPKGGEFNGKEANTQLIELITQDGRAVSREKTIKDANGRERQVVEFTHPTVVEGVTTTVGFSQENPFMSIRPNGYPLAEYVELGLEPGFVAESLGIKVSETPISQESNK